LIHKVKGKVRENKLPVTLKLITNLLLIITLNNYEDLDEVSIF
jgi:hypothetical protein